MASKNAASILLDLRKSKPELVSAIVAGKLQNISVGGGRPPATPKQPTEANVSEKKPDPKSSPPASGDNRSALDRLLNSDAVKTVQGDAKDAGFRLAGKQFVKLTRDPLVAFLAGQLGPDDPSLRAKIAKFLDTELGEALVATMLSLGLSVLPEQTGEIPKRLASELRVKAMTDVGDVVADLLMAPLRDVVSNVLRGEVKETPALPAETSTARVKMPDIPVAETVPHGAPLKQVG